MATAQYENLGFELLTFTVANPIPLLPPVTTKFFDFKFQTRTIRESPGDPDAIQFPFESIAGVTPSEYFFKGTPLVDDFLKFG